MKPLSTLLASILFYNLLLLRMSGAENSPITVVSYNIHHGEGMDGKIDLERIGRIIKGAKADLVALQEVDVMTKRTHGVDQAAELGQITGMHHVFGKAIELEGGQYGQAILSRWPIKQHRVHLLPQKPNRETRVVLVASVEAPMGELTFASTHLDHQLEDIRVQQAEKITDIFETKKSTFLILAGDFNASAESDTMAVLWKKWQDSAKANAAPTIPAGRPNRRIDYILFQPTDRWRVIRTQVLEEPDASDHRPVLSVIEPLSSIKSSGLN